MRLSLFLLGRRQDSLPLYLDLLLKLPDSFLQALYFCYALLPQLLGLNLLLLQTIQHRVLSLFDLLIHPVVDGILRRIQFSQHFRVYLGLHDKVVFESVGLRQRRIHLVPLSLLFDQLEHPLSLAFEMCE